MRFYLASAIRPARVNIKLKTFLYAHLPAEFSVTLPYRPESGRMKRRDALPVMTLALLLAQPAPASAQWDCNQRPDGEWDCSASETPAMQPAFPATPLDAAPVTEPAIPPAPRQRQRPRLSRMRPIPRPGSRQTRSRRIRQPRPRQHRKRQINPPPRRHRRRPLHPQRNQACKRRQPQPTRPRRMQAAPSSRIAGQCARR